MEQTLFGLIPTGLPPILQPTSQPTPTSLLFTIPSLPGRTYSHIVVFLLPGAALPPDTAAAVYIQLPPSSATPGAFKFLGGIGPGKESAIFKISGFNTSGDVSIGVSIEPAATVGEQMAALQQQPKEHTEQALVLAGKGGRGTPDTTILAQRIIKNAFNFLASFSGNLANGVEVVPLKAFEEWWRKFEGRVRNDPGFLERDGD
ncbi:hypothetical protein B0O99DRAFT_605669 [Bisporella sp. PMI_857]|nr:hypothetical protein B0O99DRAFT_605669 [Bisporella sp. PMI_857]